MTGNYKDKEGKSFTVRLETNKKTNRTSYEIAEERSIGYNRTYHEITEAQLKAKIKSGELTFQGDNK